MKYFLIILTFLVVSCNDIPSRSGIVSDRNTNPQTSTPDTNDTTTLPLASSFKTRLYPYLALSGNRCKGGETTQFEGQIIYCEKNQWLITIDNMNTCDDSGCTSIIVDPIVAAIELDTTLTDNQFRFFTITPVSTARARQRQILRDVNLRATRSGSLAIIQKYY